MQGDRSVVSGSAYPWSDDVPRIVGKRHARRNMHGVFAEAPIGLDPEDLEELRSQMWRDFGVDAGA